MDNFGSDHDSSCLELTIAIPGFSSSPSSGESGGYTMKDVDINQVPSELEECMGEEEDESPNNGGPAPRKKLRLNKQQSRLLEHTFRQNQNLNLKEKEFLAEQLKLKPRQVEVWFQNRRARSKLKQTEIECEYLKRWFGSLTEQNMILHKEVEELRAIKVGHQPHGCLHPPPSILTMCPRCERVTTTAAATTSGGETRMAMPHLQRRHPSAACYN